MEKIDKNARIAKRQMKKMKEQMKEEDEKLKAARKESDVFGGMSWDEAVVNFRGKGGEKGKFGGKGKNLAKMATKISVPVGDGGVVSKKRGAGGGALVLKPRGPNVGLKRAKAGNLVKKNHWDRLLHPWQREVRFCMCDEHNQQVLREIMLVASETISELVAEILQRGVLSPLYIEPNSYILIYIECRSSQLEADKREMRKQKAEKKKRVEQLKRQVDDFFDAEMDKELGRVDDQMEEEAEAGREGMKESESEYWKEHWKQVYQDEIQGKNWELQRKQEELEKKEHEFLIALSPKREDNVSGMFSTLVSGGVDDEAQSLAENDYEELKRRQVSGREEQRVAKRRVEIRILMYF